MLLTAAIVGATWYTLWNGLLIGYTLQGAMQRPIVIGFLFGIVLGDMATAMVLGAAIESIYLGTIAPGGNTPADYCAAGCVGIPIAMINGMPTEQAIALAVPIGLLGAILTIVKYLICGLFVEPAEKYADDANAGGIFRCAVIYPALCKVALVWPLFFCAVFFGADFVQAILDAIPVWVSNGLSVAGGLLPAIGFGLTIMIIGQPKFIPLFIIGYFMVQYGGLSVMACAIFAICISLFITLMQPAPEDDEDDYDEDEDEETEGETKQDKILTAGDVNRFFFLWWLFCEMPHSYQRMQALALCSAMAPALQKLYPGEENKEKLASALHREMMYFNTQGIWGASALGVALAMEEEQAVTQAMTEEEATASINGLKIGFMGPFAGVGDTIDWATLQYLLIGIGLPACAEGNPVGILPVAIGFPAITLVEGFFFTNLGYSLGRTALGQLFTSGMIDKLIDTTCMIGMMMMGALGNTYVHWTLANEAAQETLDSIIPGLLPLIAIFAVYFILTRKTQKVQYLSLGIVVLGLVLSLVGLC